MGSANMWIEIFGVVTGILFVILEVRQNSLLWPLGLITSATYVYIFFQDKFYADMGLQTYYVLISIYGWYYWKKGGSSSRKGNLPVTLTRKKQQVILIIAFLFSWIGIYYVLNHFTDSPVPLGDSFTTALAIVATWMLTRKLIEHWYLWVLANTVSVALYVYKGLYPTAILYLIYTGMALYGYKEWYKSMKHKNSNENTNPLTPQSSDP